MSCGNKPKESREIISPHDKALQWRELNCGLWVSKNGDIGLRTVTGGMGETANNFSVDFVTQTPQGDDIPLKELVDTTTFRFLNGSFYKDKKHIYNYMTMAGGGHFYVLDVDYTTFEVLKNGCYAKDRNGIYVQNHRSTIEDADYNSFEVIEGNLAQDKNGYYIWGEKVSQKEADEYLKIIRE